MTATVDWQVAIESILDQIIKILSKVPMDPEDFQVLVDRREHLAMIIIRDRTIP